MRMISMSQGSSDDIADDAWKKVDGDASAHEETEVVSNLRHDFGPDQLLDHFVRVHGELHSSSRVWEEWILIGLLSTMSKWACNTLSFGSNINLN